jgi:coatomer subunit gamma
MLYLLTQGDSLTSKEASDVFFAMTKLFQSKDSHLRRLVYLALKEIIPGNDEAIIITSSLMKDMNSQVRGRARLFA